ncbi:hypothetical protein A4X03_0g7847 [Tilletia caries]|uniref:Integrase catalytic domain-containing protein n=3 Tax=Tilletia TaxID=13289 RepID=A0A8T8SLE6_9BASI|nr:hypothetical protein A4X03_0g7847 [Tilletia caries]
MRGTKRSAAGVMVRVADGKSVPATHVADVSAVLRGQDRAQHCVALLNNVLLVPSLDANLLSTHQLARQGFITIILRNSTVLVSPSGLVIQAQIDPSTRAAYFLIQPDHFQGSEEVHANTASVSQQSGDGVPDQATMDPRAELWHRRTGHAGWAKLRKWVELGLLVGKDAPTMASIGSHLKCGRVCDVCVTANQKHAPYPDRAPSRADTPGKLVHCDYMGPFTGHPSFAWILTLVDDCTRKTWAFCLPDRSAETLTATLDAWAQQVEVTISQPVVTIKTDNGKEFVSDELQAWAKERGTTWTWTAPYSSSQNGVAERRNGLLEERMRAMLRGARLPFGFWPYAVQYAAYVINRTPSTSLEGRIPQALWSGKPVDITALRTFGCLCWTLIYPEQRQEGKLSARGLRGIFLGVGEERRAWLIFCPASPSNSLRWSRSVVFDESRTYDQSLALEEPKPVQPRNDDHVEMQLIPPKQRQRGKRQVPSSQPSDAVLPTGTPSDEDLQLQEYKLAGETQTLEPPSSVLPRPEIEEYVYELDPSRAPNAADGILPLWEPFATDPGGPQSEIDLATRIRQLERVWDGDSATPSTIMNLDDLGALLDEQEQGPPRASTPPPSQQLRRSSRIRAGARMAHGLSETFDRDEAAYDERLAVTQLVHARSAMSVLGMALHWACTAAAHGTSADGSPLEPVNLKQAKNRPSAEWAQWKQAMDEEVASLTEMGTWVLVEPRSGHNIVGSRWVYKLKLDRDGNAARYKARLVAQGFTQREGIDFKETFAPVARLVTVRLVISVALALGLHLGSIDIKTAYLNGKLHEEVYMQQPPEYDDGTGRVCLLRRAIYGLKQAGRAWFDTLKGKLISVGFSQVQSEPCLFVRFGAGGPVILAVYVDDIVIAARGAEGVARVKAEFGSWYKITDNGDLSFILGVKIDYDPVRRTAHLSQGAYIDGLLRKYGMEKEDPVPTPMTEASRHLGRNLAGQASRSAVHDFAAMIGSFLWGSQGTRGDIAFAVGHLARFMSNPGPAHFLAAKRILRYLSGTRDYGLSYSGGSQVPIAGWSDSDHGTDPSTRRSVSGYFFQVYGNTVSWRSRLQATVAMSSTEAEYVALSEAAREAKWLRSVLGDLSIKLSRATDILTDSKGAEAIARDPADHSKTKHIETHHHLVRQMQERKEVCVGRVHTDSNPADMLTKAVAREKLGSLSGIIKLGRGGSIREGVQFKS